MGDVFSKRKEREPLASSDLLEIEHLVQPGEDLTSIARRYQLTELDILASNPSLNVMHDFPFSLKIPNVSARYKGTPFYHIVHSGETLEDIAALRKIDLGLLQSYNSPVRSCSPGMVIFLKRI